jgi:hypothetical protein
MRCARFTLHFCNPTKSAALTRVPLYPAVIRQKVLSLLLLDHRLSDCVDFLRVQDLVRTSEELPYAGVM